MKKKELKEEIKKVLEGKSIYEMSPISGLNPMTKEEIIYWIVETYIDQELDKAREEGKRMVYEAIVYDENIPHEVTTFVAANLWKNMRDKAKEELSKLTTK